MSNEVLDCAETKTTANAELKNVWLCVSDWICMRVALAFVYVLIVLSRLFKLISQRRKEKKTVFVYANDLLGDTLVKMPFFFSLRAEFPREKYILVVVLTPDLAEMVGRLGLFDEIIEEPALHWRHPLFWFVRRNGIAKSLRWAFINKADIMIVCHRSRSLGCDFAMRLCVPLISVAYAADVKTPMLPMTAKYQAKMYDRRYTNLLVSEDGRHQMVDMDRLLSMATGHLVESRKLEKRDVASILDFALVKPGQDYIVIVPGARVDYRRWPTARFVEVVRRMGGNIVVVGSAEESSLAAEIIRKVDGNVVNLCGKTNLSQLGGLLSQARLVITNETGTANFAAVIGAKTVCILGGGDFGAFLPNKYCPNVTCVFHKEPCFNCGWKCVKKDISGSTTAPCVEKVSVNDVLAAALTMTA